jgi:hypothetical protein
MIFNQAIEPVTTTGAATLVASNAQHIELAG